jgi:hypothetical protein
VAAGAREVAVFKTAAQGEAEVPRVPRKALLLEQAQLARGIMAEPAFLD